MDDNTSVDIFTLQDGKIQLINTPEKLIFKFRLKVSKFLFHEPEYVLSKSDKTNVNMFIKILNDRQRHDTLQIDDFKIVASDKGCDLYRYQVKDQKLNVWMDQQLREEIEIAVLKDQVDQKVKRIQRLTGND